MRTLILALVLTVAASAGTLTLGDRSTITYLYQVGGDFASTYLNYYNLHEVRGVAGDTAIHPWSVRPLGTGHFANGTPEVAVNTDSNFLPTFFTVLPELLSGTSGNYDWGYNLPVGNSFAESFMVRGIEGGRHALFFEGGGNGGTLPGARFVSTVSIEGDWSSPALRSALGFNPTWTITHNFVFENGRTIISGFTDNYNNNDPQFTFTLYGDRLTEIPEPGTAFVVLAGLFGLAWRARRARSIAR